jgi:TonB-linked SusC/RagA family outer membrane protein
MKIFFTGKDISQRKCQNLIRIMKITFTLLLLCATGLFASEVNSQMARVNISARNVKTRVVLEEIERQTDYLFLFSPEEINMEKSISVNAKNEPVAQLLASLFRNTDISYAMEGYNIFLFKGNETKTGNTGLTQSGKITVKGIVLDESGEPVTGANVVEKGTTNGIISDIDGSFILNVDPNAILQISYIGYMTREIAVNNRPQITITLTEDTKALEEVVVIGYGVVKKKDLTGAITQVGSEDILKSNNPNLTSTLQGKIPVDIGGVWKPGSNPSIEIRGISSITGSNEPLWVIDGIPMQSTSVNLNPNDVQSIDILKDASASAIYGARGSNGVIIITTKRAEAGEAIIKAGYSGWVGFDKVSGKPNLMSAEEFVNYKRTALANAGSDYSDAAIFDEVELNSWQNRTFTDWYDEVWGGTAFATNHNFTVSASGKKTATRLSLGYLNQGSLIKTAGYKRFNLNFNNTFDFSKRLKLTTAILGSYSKNDSYTEFVYHVYQISPLGTPRDGNGQLKLTPSPNEALITNPLSEIQNNKNSLDEYGFIGSAALEWNIWDELVYKLSAGMDFTTANRGIYEGSETRQRNGGAHAASYDNSTGLSTIIDNILSYNKEINRIHRVGVMAAYNIEKYRGESVYLQGTDMYFDGLYYNLESASTILGKNTELSEWGIMSFMGRANYSLYDRYLLTLTYRYDGSSRLSDRNKWAGFPSASVAWRLSEEPFLKGAADHFLNNLKLRFSWGNTGNTNVNPYETLGRLSKTYYSWNESPAIGTIPTGIPNPDLKWEKSEEYNLGVDFSLFKYRLTGSIDMYNRKTKDLILRRNLPATSGYTEIYQNIGSTRNRGIELMLNGDIIRNSDWKWNVELTFLKNKNEILDLYGDKKDDVGSSYFIGKPIRVYYRLDYTGVWQESEAAEAAAYGAKPGYPKYKDLYNKEGESPSINVNDDRYIISRDPSWTGGLNTSLAYKGFDFYVSFYTRQGVKAYSDTHSQSDDDPVRYIGFSANHWTPENKSNSDPAPAIKGTYTEFGNSDYFIKDVSFVRISNISLGYTLPQRIIKRIKLENAKVYMNVSNPYVWTPFDGQDPQGGTDKRAYPAVTSYQWGVNINF